MNNLQVLYKKIDKLVKHPELRQQIMDNGRARSKEIHVERYVEDWIRIIEEKVYPQYERWMKARSLRKLLFKLNRFCIFKYEAFKHRLK